MSSTAGHAEGQRSVAERLGITPGALVQEIGHDDDVDQELVDSVVELSGSELSPEDSDDVVDVVLLWWREDDGDLVDALVDALTDLGDGGVIWLLTPKVGRDNYVDASDISEAAPTAGLSTTTSIAAGPEWSATKLVAPKAARSGKR